ncbi:MAG: DUF3962 domain-containing protein [Lyngbya sp. HA4199-MV5]|nr:DUF3962 domain-containing protein [Lyngbya sp. HA4199-MV5]
MNAASPTEEIPLPFVDRLQPLGWTINKSFDYSQLGKLYTLQLPSVWVDQLRSLSEVDHTPAVVSLYCALGVCAPSVVHIFRGSFSPNPARRPPYWLVALDDVVPVPELWRIIQVWLRQNYGDQIARTVATQMQPAVEQLEWREIRLQEEPVEILSAILPHLIARWLVRNGFQLGLTDKLGHSEYWNLVVASSPMETEATLVTWHPNDFSHSESSQRAKYSYYLRFTFAPANGKTPTLLLFKAGRRRYMTRSLIDSASGPSATPRVLLPKGQDSSVFLAVRELEWLSSPTDRERETTLVRLSLAHHESLLWKGRVNQILTALSSQVQIPDPCDFLNSPIAHAPRLLMLHSSRFGSYLVKTGIEAADRYELFERLSVAMPSGMVPAPSIDKVNTQSKNKKRLRGADQIPGDRGIYRIQLASSTNSELVTALQEILTASKVKGHLSLLSDHEWEFINRLGERVSIQIDKQPLPREHIAALDLQGTYSKANIAAATQSRATRIEADLRRADMGSITCQGAIVELLDYRKLARRIRSTDPKPSIRWGYAYNGQVLQFITPTEPLIDVEAFRPTDPNNEKQNKTYRRKQKQLESQQKKEQGKCVNSILDLLRQLSFPLGIPFYNGFHHTLLPNQLDIFGIYVIRVNARNHAESKVVIPVIAHVPAATFCSEVRVFLPSDSGPQEMSYYDSMSAIARLERQHSLDWNDDQIRNFVDCVFRDLELQHPALVLFNNQNIQKDLPHLVEMPDDPTNNSWHQGLRLPVQNPQLLRVARLRYSTDGLVGDVCPTAGFNRFSGLYHNSQFSDAYFSIGRSPRSAMRPAGARVRDRITKPGWNQSALEISWLCLQPEDKPEDWSLAVHRLRESSPFLNSEIVTSLPQPLHPLEKLKDYVSRLDFERLEDDGEMLLEVEEDDHQEGVQLNLF